jgi:hypothetical protein
MPRPSQGLAPISAHTPPNQDCKWALTPILTQRIRPYFGSGGDDALTLAAEATATSDIIPVG